MIEIVDFQKKFAKDLFKIHVDEMPSNDQMTEKCFFDEFAEKTRKYFIALDDGKVIGYIGLFDMVDDFNIIGIAVKKNYRRQGIGARLLNVAILEAKKRNIKSLSLEVDENNKDAINFYSKLGFKVTNIRKKYYKNSDAYVMFLFL